MWQYQEGFEQGHIYLRLKQTASILLTEGVFYCGSSLKSGKAVPRLVGRDGEGSAGPAEGAPGNNGAT